jgi:hypothetical protein
MLMKFYPYALQVFVPWILACGVANKLNRCKGTSSELEHSFGHPLLDHKSKIRSTSCPCSPWDDSCKTHGCTGSVCPFHIQHIAAWRNVGLEQVTQTGLLILKLLLFGLVSFLHAFQQGWNCQCLENACDDSSSGSIKDVSMSSLLSSSGTCVVLPLASSCSSRMSSTPRLDFEEESACLKVWWLFVSLDFVAVAT